MRIEVREGCLVRHFGAPDGPLVVCVHGFADDGTVFLPLAGAAAPFSFAAVDLPGFGASPPLEAPGVGALAEVLARVIAGLGGPAVLLAHSMGGPVAVEAARRAPDAVAGLVSLEGNMTEEDAWLSRRALKHDDPRPFHEALAGAILRRAADDPARRRGAAAALASDPLTLWRLGREVAQARGTCFGDAFAALAIPTLYVFDRASTPAATADFVERRGLAQRVLDGVGHFPTVAAPGVVAGILEDFVGAHGI